MVANKRWTLTIFAAFLLCLGCSWALLQPPYGISDEPAHAIKALATSNGQLRGPQSVGQFGYNSMEYQVPSAYSSIWHFTCYSGDVKATPVCAPPFPNGVEEIGVTSTAAEYPPAYYAIVGAFGWINPGQTGLFLMRMATVILFSFFITLSAKLLINNGYAHRLGTLLICATPTVLSFSGAVNPFSPEVGASILYWTSGLLLLKSPTSKSSGLIASVYIGAFFFGTIRPASFLWILISMSAILLVSPDFRALVSTFRKRTNSLHFLMSSALGVLASISWYLFGMQTRNLGGGSPAGGELLDNMMTSFHQTPSYLRQIFGFFGWTTFYAPTPVMFLLLLALLFLFFCNRRYRKAEIIGLICLLAFLFAGPAVFEGARAAGSGFGFQGRYLIPVAVGLPIVLTVGGQKINKNLFLTAAIPVLAITSHLISLSHVAKRFLVGLDGPFFWPSEIEWSGFGGEMAILLSIGMTLVTGLLVVVNQVLQTVEAEAI